MSEYYLFLMQVCGGVDRQEYWTECYSYNSATDTWDEFAPLNTARAHATSHQLSEEEFWIVGESIYVYVYSYDK